MGKEKKEHAEETAGQIVKSIEVELIKHQTAIKSELHEIRRRINRVERLIFGNK